MTEKEKALAGMLYDAGDPELCALRDQAKDLCWQFNQLRPFQRRERLEIIRKLFCHTGKTATVEAPFQCDYGVNISVGENFYANHNLIILDGAPVTIGNNVFIAPNCLLTTAGHPLDTEQRRTGLEYAYPIRIGDDVWLGAGVMVLPGVTIGSGSVIGAGSIVNHDIPSGVIAVGNPCRVLRRITDEDRRKYSVPRKK